MAESTGYKYLEVRPHPHRRQLYLKGRNMAVGHLVSWILANRADVAAAAWDWDLPVEAIEQALAYYHANRELVDGEFRAEADDARRRGILRDGVPFDRTRPVAADTD